MVTTVAGTPGMAGTTDGIPGAFNTPNDVAVSQNDGTLYVADTRSHTIRQVSVATGAVSTWAGAAGVSGSTNATGTAARFNGWQMSALQPRVQPW